MIIGRTADDLKAFLCESNWWDHSFTISEYHHHHQQQHHHQNHHHHHWWDHSFTISESSSSSSTTSSSSKSSSSSLVGSLLHYKWVIIILVSPFHIIIMISSIAFLCHSSSFVHIIIMTWSNIPVELMILLWGIRLCIMVSSNFKLISYECYVYFHVIVLYENIT